MPPLPKMPRPRVPRLPGMRRMKRADSLLAMLVFILAALVFAYFGGDETALRSLLGEPLQEQRPLPEAESGEEAAPTPLPAELDDTPLPRAGAPVRFLMHNVKNYFVAGEAQRSPYRIKPKAQEECEAEARLIAEAHPEIVGLIEIGGPMALEDLCRRLARHGVEYPYSKVLTRNGEDRALAILSRYPIVADDSRANQGLYGTHRRKMLRGILDVTVELPDGRRFRIVGAHLKSRVAKDEAAAASLRAREAHTLALHLQEAMRLQPNMPILVYGDWNDAPSDASLGVLRQGVDAESALTRLKPEDSRGEGWTLYYEGGHEYCTFDQIYVNKVLKKRMGGKKKSACGIVDTPDAAKASDHRALWCELR